MRIAILETKRKPAYVQEINLNNHNNNSNNNNKKAAVAELTKSSELTKPAIGSTLSTYASESGFALRWSWSWKHRRMEQCQCRANLCADWEGTAGEGRSQAGTPKSEFD